MKALVLKTLAVCALMALAGCKGDDKTSGEKKATVSGASNKKLTLTIPASVTMDRGTATNVLIKIKRENFKGPISISIDGLPKGVAGSLLEALKNIEGDEGSFTLKAADDAPLVESSMAQVTAKGPDNLAVTESFKITIKAAAGQGAGDKKLSLVVPDSVTLARGEAKAVLVKVKRENFKGAVAIGIDGLPKGVTVSVLEALKKIEGDEGTFTLKADDDAPLVENSVAKVTGKGPDNLAATESLKISIVNKP